MVLTEQDAKTIRIQKIIAILQERNGSSVRELANELGVSEMTIRRDFEYLSQTNAIKRVHGAVIYNPDFPNGGSLAPDDPAFHDLQAARFGKALAEMVEPNDRILIDSGSLAAAMAAALPSDMDYELYTYSTAVLERASVGAEQIYFIGGSFHPQTKMCESELSAEIIGRFRFSKLFLFPDGIHSEFGITCAKLYEVASKTAAIASAQKIILAAESDCFEAVSGNHIAELRSIATVVTDNGLSGFWRAHLQNMGIDIVYI